MNRIEVSDDFTGSAKIGGLGISNSSREILLIIEFAAGNISSSKAKCDSDIEKIYENAVKTIKQSGRNQIFTVLYFSRYQSADDTYISTCLDNLIYYEILLKFENQYVRYNYTITRCPLNHPELQKFVKDTKAMFTWVRDLAAFAKTIN